MAIRLRWALHGPKNHKILHLVAIDQRKARNAQPKELLGVYNPHVAPLNTYRPPLTTETPPPVTQIQTKTMQWSIPRIQYWLSVGARPSKSVARMLEKGGVLSVDSPYGRFKDRAMVEEERERLRVARMREVGEQYRTPRCKRCGGKGHGEADCIVAPELQTIPMTREEIVGVLGEEAVKGWQTETTQDPTLSVTY